jgi:hypothetical protein
MPKGSSSPIIVTYGSLEADATVTLSTTDEDISLLLPTDVSATFDASASNGSVTISGFDDLLLTTDTMSHKAGTLGAGEATITLSVEDGRIFIYEL